MAHDGDQGALCTVVITAQRGCLGLDGVAAHPRNVEGSVLWRLALAFLAFVLPLNFVRLRAAARTSSPHPQSRVFSPSDTPAALPTTLPPSQTYSVPELPAYSQLFYPNGDVRHDDSIPLPRYTPSADSHST